MSDRINATETLLTQEILLNRMTNRIRQSLELQEILSASVAEMRSFLGTDRVKIYRFQPDGTGQVIAESIYNNRLPSLLGLHFPASDIPDHAREMFVRARQRSIVSIPDQEIILSRLDHPNTTGDLSVADVQEQAIGDILKRPVDPCHVQYLTAMGVQSSLVVPILHQQQLWGLLASHHAEPRIFSEQDLQIVQLVADQVEIAIDQSHLLIQTRRKARREALINQISTLLHAPLRIQEILQLVLEKLVKTVRGSGGRLYLVGADGSTGETLFCCGNQPRLELLKPGLTSTQGAPYLLENYEFWQQILESDDRLLEQSTSVDQWASFLTAQEAQVEAIVELNAADLWAIDDLMQEPQLFAIREAFLPTQIRSVLVMPLRYGRYLLGCLTVFRNEIDTDIVWAGRHDSDERNDRVRDSFSAWRELKRGQAQSWTDEDTDMVRSLGTHLTMAVMQNRLYQCEREQRLLVEMRNQELNTARTTAEEASRLKSNFLSSTSHELRTPLASTLNYLKLLKEGFYDNEEELKEYINIAHQSAENLVAIINDVLDIAKIEAGRMSVTPEWVNLRELLIEQEKLFKPESRRKQISLIIDCMVEQLQADKMKLRQILSNLLSNAFKFTNQGEVRITVTKRSSQDSQLVEISVADTGIGIDTSKQELFEPFVQADGSIKRRYGGTGLGLTVCKRLVELMDGHIWLNSAGQDQGTTVTFTLPLVGRSQL